jgi:shikimate kinase
MNIILLGLRCSGKTTVGRLLASRLARPFVDLDDLTLELLGAATTTEAWRTAGQQAFRAAEARALARVLAGDSQIIALGGGTPMAPGAAEALAAARRDGRAVLVYLRADSHTLRARLESAAADRPAVLGESAIGEVDVLLAQRDPLYAGLADFILEADQAPMALADAIASLSR